MTESPNPTVTVLIDTFNHERFIEASILSVLGQDFPAMETEILIVDDGSTDQTPEIIRKFDSRVRLIRKENGGQASAFNVGISEARGEFIAFLDGDDWWAPNKLSRAMEYLTAHRDVGVLGHGIYEVDTVLKYTTETSPAKSREISFASVEGATFFRQTMCFFGTSRLMIRKEVAQRVIPIPESIVIEADEFLAIMSIAYSRAALLTEPLTYYRLHEDNLYQIRSGDCRKLKRMHQAISALAQELPPRLARTSVAADAIRVLVDTLENGARKLKLQLVGGMPWETFQVERSDRKFSYSGSSLGYRLFAFFSLALTLVIPPRRFYQLRRWYGSSRLRKLRGALGDPVPRAPINLADKSIGSDHEDLVGG